MVEYLAGKLIQPEVIATVCVVWAFWYLRRSIDRARARRAILRRLMQVQTKEVR